MKILLAIDGSAPSHHAIEEVAHRPWPSSSTLRILSVIQPYTPPATEVVLASATFEDVRERQTQEAEQLIREAVHGLRRPDYPSRQRFAWAIRERSLWTLPMNGKQT
jgi:nucleotide-binding universal stress UspA family protein